MVNHAMHELFAALSCNEQKVNGCIAADARLALDRANGTVSQKVTADLAEIRHLLQNTDEVYRIYRASVFELAEDERAQYLLEWIPISDQ